MSFQAYIDNVKAKTGKTPEDFIKLATERGFTEKGTKAGLVMDWLKKDFGLGHGHSMAIYHLIKSVNDPDPGIEEAIAKHFSGKKAHWREAFDGLIKKLKKFGDNIELSPASAYISILKGKKKFAILQFTVDRIDIGIKLKDAEPNERFAPAGTWNEMITHRVKITDAKEIDKELLAWIMQAYEKV